MPHEFTSIKNGYPEGIFRDIYTKRSIIVRGVPNEITTADGLADWILDHTNNNKMLVFEIIPSEQEKYDAMML